MEKKILRTRKKERGQSFTELALSFTLLVLILAVIYDGGRIFFSYIAMRDAVEEGALHGSLFPTDTSGIEARVRTSSTDPVDFSDTGVVTVSSFVTGDACAGNTVTVTVTYVINMTMPFVGTILGTQNFPLSASETSTILRPPC